MTEKMTKRDWFVTLDSAIDSSNLTEEEKAGAHDFIASEVEKIDARAMKAQEKAAEKKAAGDPLKDMVYAVLTDEFQTTDEIFNSVIENNPLDTEDVTKAKVINRLSQITREGLTDKTMTKQGPRRATAYKLIGNEPEEA